MHNVTESQYIPGVCNIGPAETQMRMRVGWIGLALSVLIWTIFVYFDVERSWFLLLFFPAAISAVGFIQGIMHFCAAFGLRSVFNMGPDVGKTDTIMQAEFRAKDRAKARQILGYSLAVGLSVSLLAHFLK
jgi:hypothetical protein